MPFFHRVRRRTSNRPASAAGRRSRAMCGNASIFRSPARRSISPPQSDASSGLPVMSSASEHSRHNAGGNTAFSSSRWRSPLLRSVRFTFERCNDGPGARRSRHASSPSMIAIRPWRNSQRRKFSPWSSSVGRTGSKPASRKRPSARRSSASEGRDTSRLLISNSRRSSGHHARLMRTSSSRSAVVLRSAANTCKPCTCRPGCRPSQ